MSIKVLVTGDIKNLKSEVFRKKLHLYIEPMLERNHSINFLCKEEYTEFIKEYFSEHKLFNSGVSVTFYKPNELTDWSLSELIKTTADCAIIFSNTENSSSNRLIELCEWFSGKYRVVNYN